MKFKKRINGSWTDIPHYIHNTDTDTITTLPTAIYPTGTTATVGLKGQTVQSSIPSPTSPIIPQGTGERTGNLFDISTLENGIYLAANGNKYGNVTNGVRAGTKIKVSRNTVYTLSAQSSGNVSLRVFEWSDGIFTKQTPIYNISGNVNITVTTTAETTEIAFNIEGENAQYATNIMLNAGSTALPCEPYGYKLDISCGDTVTPIYLGEIATTRQVKKLVLTGEENFTIASIDANRTVCQTPLRGCKGSYGFCTHIVWKSSYESSECNRLVWTTTSGGTLFISLSNDYLEGQTAADFKAYLAAQYANGTPVTVWYILAKPETGIVNEPLMKIGDYADEIINISVPTIIGTNTFNIDTVVQPSEVTLNYHGWHPIDNTHEHDNGEWN